MVDVVGDTEGVWEYVVVGVDVIEGVEVRVCVGVTEGVLVLVRVIVVVGDDVIEAVGVPVSVLVDDSVGIVVIDEIVVGDTCVLGDG